MNLLIFLTHPEPTRSGYEKYLAVRHPELAIKTVATRDEALKHAAWADILMAFGPQVKTDFFRNTPRLKWVHSLGTGTDGIIDSPYLGKDVIVTATRGIHGPPISELAFLLMLAFNRDFRRIERQREAKAWQRFPGRLLDGKTVGILGVGAIAEGLGPRCKAFGMRVVGISRTSARSRALTKSIRVPRSRRPRPSSTISCCCCRSRPTPATSSTTACSPR